jgi:hypothetical protein
MSTVSENRLTQELRRRIAQLDKTIQELAEQKATYSAALAIAVDRSAPPTLSGPSVNNLKGSSNSESKASLIRGYIEAGGDAGVTYGDIRSALKKRGIRTTDHYLYKIVSLGRGRQMREENGRIFWTKKRPTKSRVR